MENASQLPLGYPHNEAQIVNHDFPKLILVLFSLRSIVVNASSIYFFPKMKKKYFPFFSDK